MGNRESSRIRDHRRLPAGPSHAQKMTRPPGSGTGARHRGPRGCAVLGRDVATHARHIAGPCPRSHCENPRRCRVQYAARHGHVRGSSHPRLGMAQVSKHAGGARAILAHDVRKPIAERPGPLHVVSGSERHRDSAGHGGGDMAERRNNGPGAGWLTLVWALPAIAACGSADNGTTGSRESAMIQRRSAAPGRSFGAWAHRSATPRTVRFGAPPISHRAR